MQGELKTKDRIERRTDRRTHAADREQRTLADYTSDSTMDFLVEALPDSYDDVLSTEPDPNGELANYKIGGPTPARTTLPDNVDDAPGVRAFGTGASGVIEMPATQYGGDR